MLTEFIRQLSAKINYRVNSMAHNLKVVGSNPTPATNFSSECPCESRAFAFLDVIADSASVGAFRGILAQDFPLFFTCYSPFDCGGGKAFSS
jgi:hypothetical protein